MLKAKAMPRDSIYQHLAKGMIILVGILLAITMVTEVYQHKVQKYYSTTGMPVGTSVKERMTQIDCLSKNIYWEAANEPFEGKVAVAQVTINRVKSGKFADNICGVVYQKNVIYNKIICQFSWYCEIDHKRKMVHPKLYEESEEVAKKVLLEGYRLDSMKDALFYHADYVNPKWKLEKIGKIGAHIFYKGKTNEI